MIIDKQVSREIGHALIHSYGAMMGVLQFLVPLEALFLQALDKFMYRMGVPRSQMILKFADEMLFTYGYKTERSRTLFIVTDKPSLPTSTIENPAFRFHWSRTV